MNTLHVVSPEKVMALLDGELSAAEAHQVSHHVEHCSECTRLSEQLRATSQVLSGWTVPAVASEFEIRIQDAQGERNSGLEVGRASLGGGPSFRPWRRWVYASAGTVAALVLMLALFRPKPAYSPLRQAGEIVAYQGTEDGQGSIGKFAGRPSADQRSRGFELKESIEKAQGHAADSNGRLHEFGEYGRASFPINGQREADQAGAYQAPMIARTVSLSIVVKDFTASRASLDAVLLRHHGYSAQLSVSTPENAPRTVQASLRVPAPELASAVVDIKALGRVESESQSGEEVTRQHADLASRLRNARDTEQRFRAILQQRTGNVAEVLQVEEGIARVRGDIERMEAEQKALEHRVDFSTIELQLTEEYKAQLNPPAASVSTRMHNAFVAGYHNASETVLGIVLFFGEYGPTLLIWLVILVLPVVFLWKRYRRGMAAV